METHEERTAQLIADPNFEIGNHGLRHLDMARLSGDALKDEIVLTEAAYIRARKNLLARQCAVPTEAGRPLVERTSLLRFPYGRCNAASLAAAAAHGQLAIQWDVVTAIPIRAVRQRRSPRRSSPRRIPAPSSSPTPTAAAGTR